MVLLILSRSIVPTLAPSSVANLIIKRHCLCHFILFLRYANDWAKLLKNLAKKKTSFVPLTAWVVSMRYAWRGECSLYSPFFFFFFSPSCTWVCIERGNACYEECMLRGLTFTVLENELQTSFFFYSQDFHFSCPYFDSTEKKVHALTLAIASCPILMTCWAPIAWCKTSRRWGHSRSSLVCDKALRWFPPRILLSWTLFFFFCFIRLINVSLVL